MDKEVQALLAPLKIAYDGDAAPIETQWVPGAHFLTTKKMTDLASHADRVRVTHQDTTFWSLSVDWCRRHTPDDHERAPIIDQYLAERDPSHTP